MPEFYSQPGFYQVLCFSTRAFRPDKCGDS